MSDDHSWLSTTPWGRFEDLAINITPSQTSALDMKVRLPLHSSAAFLFLRRRNTYQDFVIVTECDCISSHFFWTLGNTQV
jgi:hypothetical protein